MNRRQAYKKKRKTQTRRNQMWLMIGTVGVIAVVAAVVLILQNSKPVVGDFTPVATQTWPMASGTSMGPAGAKVVVMEFADFQCPYCDQFHNNILPKLVKDYVGAGKIRFEYHHYTVIDSNTGGNESHRAAEASECAADQGRFWDYYNILFTNQQGEGSGAFSDVRLKAFAASLGLNTNDFNSCFDSGKDASRLQTDMNMVTQYQLDSTPSLVVNGVKVANPMDYNTVKAAIDAALK